MIARIDNSSTWASFDIAYNTYQNHSYDGIGFVFTNNDPYIGIDLDNCIIDNIVNSFTQKIINLINSYTEYSPSGNGLHIICKANQFKNQLIGIKKNNIEVYNYNRFFTITGDVFLKQLINQRSYEINLLIKNNFFL